MKTCIKELAAWRRRRRVMLPSVRQLTESLALLDGGDAAPQAEDSDSASPVFLLSTGWRAGSTLVQRILVTDRRLLLWGEPLGRMALVPRLTEMLTAVSRAWPSRDNWIADHTDTSSMSGSWIANFYPRPDDLRAGLRRLLDEWLCAPATSRGFQRWGVKEVRFSAADATLLRWLYPRAKFVLLTRHPFACYSSFSACRRTFYFMWPDWSVASAADFAHHWNRIAVSWSDLAPDFPCYQLKYEDVVAGKVNWRDLEDWLGLTLEEDVALSIRVGGTATNEPVPACQRFIIRREAAIGMAKYGYSA